MVVSLVEKLLSNSSLVERGRVLLRVSTMCLALFLTVFSQSYVALGQTFGPDLIINGQFNNFDRSGPRGRPDDWDVAGPEGGIHRSTGRSDGSSNFWYYPIGGWNRSAGGSVAQTVTTIAGQTYRLRFHHSKAFGDSMVGVVSAESTAGNQTLATFTATRINEFREYDFVANSTSTTIKFTLQSSVGDVDWDIDNVSLFSLTPTPEITVSSSVNGAIADGGTDAQGTIIANQTQTITYTVTNNGTADLTLATATAGTLTNVSTPVISAPGSTTVAAGATTTFTVSFSALAGGAFSFPISFTNNDADENPYDIIISGTADFDPSLTVTKTADKTVNVAAGELVTYTYVVTNNGNQVISGITLSDAHGGSGPAPTPADETLTADNGTTGDSVNGPVDDGVWNALGPGDVVTFTATYTVTQNDVNTLQ